MQDHSVQNRSVLTDVINGAPESKTLLVNGSSKMKSINCSHGNNPRYSYNGSTVPSEMHYSQYKAQNKTYANIVRNSPDSAIQIQKTVAAGIYISDAAAESQVHETLKPAKKGKVKDDEPERNNMAFSQLLVNQLKLQLYDLVKVGNVQCRILKKKLQESALIYNKLLKVTTLHLDEEKRIIKSYAAQARNLFRGYMRAVQAIEVLVRGRGSDYKISLKAARSQSAENASKNCLHELAEELTKGLHLIVENLSSISKAIADAERIASMLRNISRVPLSQLSADKFKIFTSAGLSADDVIED